MQTEQQNTEIKPTHLPEDNVYAAVYRALLVGMIVSTALFVVGLIRGMLLHTFFPLDEKWITSHYHLSVAIHGLMTLDPTVLMMVATVLLIITPVVRVIVSIITFAVDHDYKYVLVTSTVLVVMIVTYVLSRFGLH